MNQNDLNQYPAGGYPGGETYQGYPSQQRYQPSAYQAPAQGYPQPAQRSYQTPQVTGNQPPVSGYQGGYPSAAGTGSQAAMNGYQGTYPNPYARQGVPQAQPGFGGTNTYIPVNSYPQQNMQQGGYPQGGYPQGAAQTPVQQGTTQQGYPYPAGQVPGTSYIPQTPYQQSYPTGGYPQQGNYAQGYNAYAQMGRGQQIPVNQNQPQGQVPLNGGGYVPQPVPVKRKPFVMNDSDLLILSAILLILFALGLFVPSMGFLKWVFLALAAGSTALLWIKPLVANNKRLCYTIVFVLLMLVTVFGVVVNRTGGNGGTGNQTSGDSGANVYTSAQQTAAVEQIYSETQTQAPVTNTPEPEGNTQVQDRLQTFFYYWSANRQDDMLTLCAPSWQNKVENPKTALFGLMANRTPKDYMVESVSGTDNDTSRTVTVNSLMDRNNGKDPVRYRLGVIMLKENEQWFVDPASLQTYEAADTPDPSITSTPAPTETPAVYANTVLYYNPSGGEYYHLDQNCKRINERYLPLKGHFTYAELSSDKYSKLKPCAICGAPSAGQ